MKLCDFPLLSSELAQFTCDDLGTDWQIGEAVSVQAHGHEYLARLGDCDVEPVPVCDLEQLSCGFDVFELGVRKHGGSPLKPTDTVS